MKGNKVYQEFNRAGGPTEELQKHREADAVRLLGYLDTEINISRHMCAGKSTKILFTAMPISNMLQTPLLHPCRCTAVS